MKKKLFEVSLLDNGDIEAQPNADEINALPDNAIRNLLQCASDFKDNIGVAAGDKFGMTLLTIKADEEGPYAAINGELLEKLDEKKIKQLIQFLMDMIGEILDKKGIPHDFKIEHVYADKKPLEPKDIN